MEHPISELMQTAMSSMKDMVDVNTVVGHPVQASSGSTIIPISRVTFGYMTAGGDLLADKPAKDAPDFPFASTAIPRRAPAPFPRRGAPIFPMVASSINRPTSRSADAGTSTAPIPS